MKVCATKEQMAQTGVYCILNTANGKRYVGSAARSFDHRFERHCRPLNNGTHHSSALQRAWNKYGAAAFEFRIVEVTAPEHAVAQEQVFINYWKTADKTHGYNMSPTAGSIFGLKYSAEAREKMSAANRRRGPVSDKTRAKMSSAKKGRAHTAKSRQNMAAAQVGRVHSEATRKKMSLSRKSAMNSDLRAKIVEANKARVWGDVSRKKQSLAQSLRRQSRDTQTGRFIKSAGDVR